MRVVARGGGAAPVPVVALAGALLLGLGLAWLPLPLAVAAVLGPALLLLLLRFPLAAVALMLLAGPWGALENVLLGNAFLDSGQLSFLLLVAIWLARGVLLRRRAPPFRHPGIRIPRTPLDLPLLLFLAVRCAAGEAAPLVAPSFSPVGVTSDTVRGWLTRPMTAEHIAFAGGDTEDCRLRGDALLIAAGGNCRFTLTPSPNLTRRLSLRLAEGESAAVTLQQENTLDIEETLVGIGAAIELDIFRQPEGVEAILTVANCTTAESEEEEAPAACRLEIE